NSDSELRELIVDDTPRSELSVLEIQNERIRALELRAVGNSVAIEVVIRDAAAAKARPDLAGVFGARVMTIQNTVAVGIDICLSASAKSGGGLVGIPGTSIDAIRHAIAISVRFGQAASTNARRG